MDLAKAPIEKNKIEIRLEQAKADFKSRNCEAVAINFTTACAQSLAVFNCNLLKLHREVASGADIFETYHDLERLRLRTSLPSKFDWDKLRPQAEIELLGTHQHLDKIHYACLSLNKDGLDHYGECTVILAPHMIAHRASCFEGNTAVCFAMEHSFSVRF